jgi:hypothetical protein
MGLHVIWRCGLLRLGKLGREWYRHRSGDVSFGWVSSRKCKSNEGLARVRLGCGRVMPNV